MAGFDRRLIIVVAANNVVAANAAAKTVDTVGGERTFQAWLSPTGALPPTHFWCGWTMTADDDTALRGGLTGLIASGRARVFDGLTTTREQVLAATGLQPIRLLP